MTEVAAVALVNKKIEADSILKSIFSPTPVHVFPGLADEPLGGGKSYPYIRYLYIPNFSRNSIHIRRDSVQYVIGDKDLTTIERALERIIYILNTDTATLSSDLPAADPAGRYEIQAIEVNNGTPLSIPSQDEGVWEQGINCTIVYTIINHGWELTTNKNQSIDSLLS